MELDAQLDNIDIAQKISPLDERVHLRVQLCREYTALLAKLHDLNAESIQRRSNRADITIRGRQQLKWDEAIELALSECTCPLTIDEIAYAIKQGAWMRANATIDEFTVRSAVDRYKARLGIIKLKGTDRRSRYWLASRGPWQDGSTPGGWG